MTRRWSVGLAVVTLLASLAACRPAAPRAMLPPTASPVPSNALVIGALVNLSDDDPSHRQTFEAMSLAIESINRRGGIELPAGQRRPVRLAAYDIAGSADRVGPDLRRLADEDQAVAVIGPADDDSATVARRLAEQLELPLVALAAAPEPGSGGWRWTFALAPDDDAPVAALVDYLAASGVTQIGWLAPRTAAASAAQAALTRQIHGTGITVVGNEIYPLGDVTLAARQARLKAAGAQVLVAWPQDTRGAISLLVQLKGVPDRLPLFLGPAAANPKALALDGGTIDGLHTITPRLGVADDLWDHDPITPHIRDFSRAFRQRFNATPGDDSAAAWDAVQLLEQALRQAGPTRAAVRVALEQTTDLVGVSGLVSFSPSRHAGLDRRAFVVARSTDGRWRLPP
jgi:branched-chain amino acid transport system substrate-binding protein